MVPLTITLLELVGTKCLEIWKNSPYVKVPMVRPGVEISAMWDRR